MTDIFRIETERTNLSWSENSETEHAAEGRLAISPSSRTRKQIKIWRGSLPDSVAHNLELEVGPRLYEETPYSLLLSSGDKRRVQLRHRDPEILRTLHSSADGRIVHGTIDFKDQIGRSRFSVCVDGEIEYDFEVEVFPAKLDYTADYKVLLADVQEIVSGLVLDYLKSTFQLGFATDVNDSSRLEWILLLRHVVDDLERGLRYVEKHPHHGLVRERVLTRIERLRRPDATISKLIRQGKGCGPKTRTASGIELHSKLPEHRARTTLDTPEHRWLASQLTRIRRTLAEIRLAEIKSWASQDPRQVRILEELENLEDRISKLRVIEPLAQAKGFPPPGFTSLTLQARSGYREAYRACLILLQGLKVNGGPVELVSKDIGQLYEYWCYLALLRLVAKIIGEKIPVRKLFSVQKHGLRVQLKRGTTQTVVFSNGNRSLELTYNPRYAGRAPRPDVIMTLRDPRLPTLRLAIDAGYHIDPTAGYVKEFGSPGPPIESLAVLHRYRDGVMHQTGLQGAASDITKDSVMKGVVLFPFTDVEDQFRNNKFWTSLQQEGLGAIPFLPAETRYLEEWLRTVLQQNGWSTSEKPIPYLSSGEERRWQHAEKVPVLIATLRQDAREHFGWMKQNCFYYTPLIPTDPRQLATRWIAIYAPASMRTPESITHLAEVGHYKIRKRGDIDTPWAPEGDADEMQVVYHVREFQELERPLENRGPKGLNKHFFTNQWTSRLAILRATELLHVLMKSCAEWKLYGELRMARADFTLKPSAARLRDVNDHDRRMWFVKPRLQVQYRDAAGYLIRRPGMRDEYVSNVNDVVERFTSPANKKGRD